jgi:phytoene dehydrogenase-like protein
MVHEVVVVGGGIGGLTVAALLAARGVDVCLFERGSQVGGVVAPVEGFGYNFDPGVGIYPCWEPGEIHDQVFSELPVAQPEVRLETPAYVVRLPDTADVPVVADDDQFLAALAAAFPECANEAISFYRQCSAQCSTLTESFKRGKTRNEAQIVSQDLENTSARFRQFIDAQLHLLAQSSLANCEFQRAACALTIPRRGNYSIKGGAAALANCLADAIKQSGGRVRLNTPVLRLAYDSAGRAKGIDLLTGETIAASRAIISNLTVWDTLGKLVGLNRTPVEIRKMVGSIKGWGAYLVYLGINEATAANLVSDRIVALSELESDFPPESQFILASAPSWDPRAPVGKRAVTVLTFTDVEEWFTFHESTEELEEQDQTKLEAVWQRLHKALPELGDGIEVIESSTPLDCYELTRRKLGMITWPGLRSSPFSAGSTFLENVFMVGDSADACPGLASVTRAALKLADKLTKS